MRAGWLLLSLAGCDRVFQLVEVKDVSDRDSSIDDVAVDVSFAPGLVAYFPFDTIANSRTAELTRSADALCAVDQCPLAVTSALVGALDFDGVNDMLQVPAYGDLETQDAFSVTVWMRQDAVLTTDDYGCVVSKRLGPNELNTWQLCLGGFNATDLGFYSTGSSATANDILYTGEPFPLDEWHHVALIWDGVEKSLYLDGTRKAFGPVDVVFDGGDVLIGADVDFGSQIGQFPGRIDDLRIYNRALSVPEILDLMQ